MTIEGSGTLRQLVEALREHGRFEHAVQHCTIIETHISLVLLTGRYAYKFKKPLNLGFLDFTTLDKRRHFCEEELRLNRRLAPRHYLDVVPVTGPRRRPRVGGAGPALEFAVKMLQFPREMELDTLVARAGLSPELADRLARRIADFHDRAAAAPGDGRFGSTDGILQPALQNFEAPAAALRGNDRAMARLHEIEAWTRASCAALEEVFKARLAAGRVHECHGDMHLGNMVLHDGELVIFDCIEFCEELRWIDVMSELAFLLMDLDCLRQTGPAWRLLNAYLEHSGDYAGLSVLRFYQVYRAMVRAKVAAIRLAQENFPAGQRDGESKRLVEHLDLARHYLYPAAPALIITHGLSGSGKTHLTQCLLERLGAVRLRSDLERKRMHGLPAAARTGSAAGEGIYSAASGAAVYHRLRQLAAAGIRAGYRVIVDATFLRREQRSLFAELARETAVPYLILELDADERILRERIRRRAAGGSDASEADGSVLEYQIASREPLEPGEGVSALRINSGATADAQRLAAAIRSRIE
ncbi:MAG: AAA family ATPase [Gammaproteobacteria bacterium]|nr:AAA family ATPase [Gammaproteobacteria bacterium]